MWECNELHMPLVHGDSVTSSEAGDSAKDIKQRVLWSSPRKLDFITETTGS